MTRQTSSAGRYVLLTALAMGAAAIAFLLTSSEKPESGGSQGFGETSISSSAATHSRQVRASDTAREKPKVSTESRVAAEEPTPGSGYTPRTRDELEIVGKKLDDGGWLVDSTVWNPGNTHLTDEQRQALTALIEKRRESYRSLESELGKKVAALADQLLKDGTYDARQKIPAPAGSLRWARLSSKSDREITLYLTPDQLPELAAEIGEWDGAARSLAADVKLFLANPPASVK